MLDSRGPCPTAEILPAVFVSPSLKMSIHPSGGWNRRNTNLQHLLTTRAELDVISTLDHGIRSNRPNDDCQNWDRAIVNSGWVSVSKTTASAAHPILRVMRIAAFLQPEHGGD